MRKQPPIVIPRGKLRPQQRAPLIQTRVVDDKRSKIETCFRTLRLHPRSDY